MCVFSNISHNILIHSLQATMPINNQFIFQHLNGLEAHEENGLKFNLNRRYMCNVRVNTN